MSQSILTKSIINHRHGDRLQRIIRSVTVIALSLVYFMMTLSCNHRKSLLPEHVTCRCLLTPTSSPHDTYLIEVSDDRIITTTFGWCPDTVMKMIKEDRHIAQYDKNLVERIEKREEREIPPQKYVSLLDLLDTSSGVKYDNPFIEGWAWDAWIVVLMTKTDQFIYMRDEEPNETIKFLVNELISLSPVPFSEDKLVGGRKKIVEVDDSLTY